MKSSRKNKENINDIIIVEEEQKKSINKLHILKI